MDFNASGFGKTPKNTKNTSNTLKSQCKSVLLKKPASKALCFPDLSHKNGGKNCFSSRSLKIQGSYTEIPF
jgi:hypothetical protein